MTEYLLDTCIIIEILQANEKTLLWLEDNQNEIMHISGWTILELIREKSSKVEMENCLKNLLSQYKTMWAKPEDCDQVPSILIEKFHSKREQNRGAVKGSCVFDCFIYETSKSNNNPIIVTRDGDFDLFTDVEVLNLNKVDKYKLD